jgi:hypothetical protein
VRALTDPYAQGFMGDWLADPGLASGVMSKECAELIASFREAD